jgi:hypothetical protein
MLENRHTVSHETVILEMVLEEGGVGVCLVDPADSVMASRPYWYFDGNDVIAEVNSDDHLLSPHKGSHYHE